jgi:REP element-mobilizing transposase RayT
MNPRFKIESRHSAAVYHCISHTTAEVFLDDRAKEILRKHLWQVADYCGVHVLTYAIMSTHFHVLVRVPLKTDDVPDAELLRRHNVLHPRLTQFQAARMRLITEQLKTGGLDASAWRKQQLGLMCDISPFMKLFKQRFSIWFNRAHKRRGTLWSERFKSVIVEGRGNVLSTMAAYIDLNPVRAGITDDPKDYRFCGYAEALNGNKTAQTGITNIVTDGQPGEKWSNAHNAYRMRLFGAGVRRRAGKAAMTPAQLAKVMGEKGALPLASVLRCRVRYFSDGVVLGSKAFVAKHLALYQRKTGLRKRISPQDLPPITDWGGMVAMRGLRKNACVCHLPRTATS